MTGIFPKWTQCTFVPDHIPRHPTSRISRTCLFLGQVLIKSLSSARYFQVLGYCSESYLTELTFQRGKSENEQMDAIRSPWQ